MQSFRQRLLSASQANESLLCIGLDPDPALMAIPDVADFNRAIVDATSDLVCAYKPNLPFYEAFGSRGIAALEETVAYIRERAPRAVVLGDGKRGDIGSTNARYAAALFETWGFDAATVNCFGGGEALEPFLEYEDKGIIVWCRSSNPGADEFQDLHVASQGGPQPLYQVIATRALEWDRRGNVGLVVGATYPAELKAVRGICRDMPILVPAIGAQGGDLSASVLAGMDDAGRNLLMSSSRSVTYASRDPADFADQARSSAQALRDEINAVLEEGGMGW
jgi:orotidine-5'-phosphate decarboxylase